MNFKNSDFLMLLVAFLVGYFFQEMMKGCQIVEGSSSDQPKCVPMKGVAGDDNNVESSCICAVPIPSDPKCVPRDVDGGDDDLKTSVMSFIPQAINMDAGDVWWEVKVPYTMLLKLYKHNDNNINPELLKEVLKVLKDNAPNYNWWKRVCNAENCESINGCKLSQ